VSFSRSLSLSQRIEKFSFFLILFCVFHHPVWGWLLGCAFGWLPTKQPKGSYESKSFNPPPPPPPPLVKLAGEGRGLFYMFFILVSSSSSSSSSSSIDSLA
jgi:hypothetical protein